MAEEEREQERETMNRIPYATALLICTSYIRHQESPTVKYSWFTAHHK